jgi:hypothetical protein
MRLMLLQRLGGEIPVKVQERSQNQQDTQQAGQRKVPHQPKFLRLGSVFLPASETDYDGRL